MKILVVEDEEVIAAGLAYSLEQEGYETMISHTVKEAYSCMERDSFDLYLLDLTLPDGSGYDICKQVKSRFDVPVIFLTAFDDEINVVMGLELGADDYIYKPFRLKELLARVKTVLRRYHREDASGTIVFKDLKVLTKEAKVFLGQEEILLTAMEYRLLLVLLQNKGIVLSRNNLLENLWDVDGDFVNDNTLTVYIKRLRAKLNDTDETYIRTVRGRGYTLAE